MHAEDGPTITLTAEDAWQLRHGCGVREFNAELQRLAAWWQLENGLNAEMVPLAEAAAAYGCTAHALRQRINRGSVTGRKVRGRWWVVLPSSWAAAPSRP